MCRCMCSGMTLQVDWYMFPMTRAPFLPDLGSVFGLGHVPRDVAGPSSTSRYCFGCGAVPGAVSGAGAEGVAFPAFFFLDLAGRRRSRLMLFACAATFALAGTRPNAFAIA